MNRSMEILALAIATMIGIATHVHAQASSSAATSTREKFAVQERRVWRFEETPLDATAEPFGAVMIDNEFSGARVHACERIGPFEYKIVTSPENLPINPSPWYAFRVRREPPHNAAVKDVEIAPCDIVVRIVITSSKSRPWPRVSIDGGPFQRVSRDRYEGSEGAKECVLRLSVGKSPVIVAANDMIGIGEIEGWLDGIGAQLSSVPREIGRSRGQRAIRALEFGAVDATERIVIIGRQHPPEVSGTVGFMRFVETLAAETGLAREFRQRFRVLCVPLVNPDGVHEGNWRSTLGHVDANRDWNVFSEPETRAVRDAILAFAREPNAKLRLLLDFHATNKDIFYVPPDSAKLSPPHFARDWLAAIAKRFPDYALASSATNNVDEWTFKRWAFETFAAPGITYELGSNTPHEKIGVIVPGAAEEAMRLLLASDARNTGKSETNPALQDPASAPVQSAP
ncbi:MAG: M14 family metallopeptidase [Limnohabitans sp.]|nr:M14 family metallopeptidase [Limnohabitans sp.]